MHIVQRNYQHKQTDMLFHKLAKRANTLYLLRSSYILRLKGPRFSTPSKSTDFKGKSRYIFSEIAECS